MPELPEAETIVRGLRSTIVGKRIDRVEVLRADILREPKKSFEPKVRGRSVRGVDRRAKNVLIRLDGGHVIAVNLGMTGRLLPFHVPPRGTTQPKHVAIRFRFRSGGVLIFDDTRRFGSVECLTTCQWIERSSRIGPEPLADQYAAETLYAGLSMSRSPVRSWLLDQRRIAGLGNIYAAEALFIAGIHPHRSANGISFDEAKVLHGSIRRVLSDAIGEGGTTIRDYRTAEGREGKYARKLKVYGREGEACPACTAVIEKVVFGSRSAFFCPTCQPASGR